MSSKDEKSVVYSALEVANICSVVNQTAINWIRQGHLKAFSTPGGQFRVYPDDLVAFMKKRKMRIPDDLLVQCEENKTEDKEIKILIVDDDQAFNTIVERAVEKNFANSLVFHAYDGFEAGVRLVEKQPKCLILDINLPGIDGLTLCQRIKSTDAFGNPEIIVVTAMEEEGIEQKCREFGVKYFFKKPVFTPELMKVIAEVFSLRNSL